MTADRNPVDIEAIDAQASVLMKKGIDLMQGGGADAAGQALACFDQALELRRDLPMSDVPLLRYGLAACWLNRADALMRIGDAGSLAEALRSHDEALALLRTLSLAEDVRFLKRLAIAHQNRALSLLMNGRPVEDAFASLDAAVAVLEGEAAAALPDRRYLAAAVWTNIANVRVSDETAASDVLARDAALRAIALMAGEEETQVDAAEVGLKARHVLCQTCARRLSQTPAGEPVPADHVHDATDAVDEGLRLARLWEQNGDARFRDLASDLFRFGVRVYESYQPQFVVEFVTENMDPNQSSRGYVEHAAMRAAADEALAYAAPAAQFQDEA